MLDKSKKRCIFAPPKAQMAESVDALVSNTSGFTSMPVRSRLWVPQMLGNLLIIKHFCFSAEQIPH